MEPSIENKRIRFLLAKIGIDGHYRGALIIARALKDSGMEVIFLGPWCKPEEVVSTAEQEDVDVIGISTLGGDHLLIPKLMDELKKRNLNIPVIVGGIIPPDWEEKFEKLGVVKIFRPGSDIGEIINFIKNLVMNRRGGG
jgi:methylmalonyl-CoA mutase C-terminal domain/subunit